MKQFKVYYSLPSMSRGRYTSAIVEASTSEKAADAVKKMHPQAKVMAHEEVKR